MCQFYLLVFLFCFSSLDAPLGFVIIGALWTIASNWSPPGRFISLGQSIWGNADLVIYLRIRVTRGKELRAAPNVQSSSVASQRQV